MTHCSGVISHHLRDVATNASPRPEACGSRRRVATRRCSRTPYDTYTGTPDPPTPARRRSGSAQPPIHVSFVSVVACSPYATEIGIGEYGRRHKHTTPPRLPAARERFARGYARSSLDPICDSSHAEKPIAHADSNACRPERPERSRRDQPRRCGSEADSHIPLPN